MKPRKSNLVDADKVTSTTIPFAMCYAKTYTASDETKRLGRTVFNHCQIVGEVADELLARLPPKLRTSLFPEGAALGAAAHDIGKVSPTFQEKILRGTTGYTNNSHPVLVGVDPTIEIERWGGHAGVSQATADNLNFGKFIPQILGQHHGYSPQVTQLADDAIFGGIAWHQERIALTQALRDHFKTDWPAIENLAQARALAGLTSVADWIGSGPFFEHPDDPWQEKIQQAVDNAGFIKPKIKTELTFHDVFGFSPHDAQVKLIEQAAQPGIYILEAPMGLGKTEAALYAAYLALANEWATGIYFALPTQLTSNKIHERVNKFLDMIIHGDCQHRKSLLLHSNAWLAEMGEEGQPGGAWFAQGKRGILAPFAVGTIDQALMAVMNVKHGFVRAFGLAGKVVILDEVHTYDAYTGTILDALVAQLRELGCMVIILSATLNKERRAALLKQTPQQDAYPLISGVSSGAHVLTEVSPIAPPEKHVQILMAQDVKLCVDEALLRAQQGQQVLWIENTVKDAQQQYALFAAQSAELNIECGLLHSRFTKLDRENNEQKWVEIFGGRDNNKRYTQGRILVGTQVLEQSLDIDADFLVSQFCPTDMLFQRLGRLWRHERAARHTYARCEAWIIAPDTSAAIENPDNAFGLTASVYSPYVLCRSLAVWHPLTCVSLPGDIRTMIEATYQEQPETARMEFLRHELENGRTYKGRKRLGRKAMAQMALVGLSIGGKTLPENKASTRYSEQETVECLLLAAKPQIDLIKKHSKLRLLNGDELIVPFNGKQLNKTQWRRLAATLARNVVVVSEYNAPQALRQDELNWLKDYFYLGNQHEEESQLRIGIVSPSGELFNLHGTTHNKYQLFYDAALGFQTYLKQE